MNGILGLLSTLLPFFGVLLVLVIVHELGHFITAKLAGVTVEEFGFGYPPRIFAVKYKGTDYSLNLLPLGGFVKLVGEEDPSETGSLASRSPLTRLIILGAGPFMNALLPIVLLTASFMLPKDTVTGQVVIQAVAPESPAAGAGLQEGDMVLRINDRAIESIRDVGYNIQLNLGSELEMTLKRGSETKEVRVTPRWSPPAGQGATGIAIAMPDPKVVNQSLSPFEAFGTAVQRSFDMLSLFKNGIYAAIAGRSSGSAPAVTGPIGIAQATGEIAQAGVPSLLEWMALLSINLAILNALPIPMLDGGRMFFVLLEWVRRGRRVRPEREGLVHMVGFVVLMGLIAIISFFDVLRLIRGESLFR